MTRLQVALCMLIVGIAGAMSSSAAGVAPKKTERNSKVLLIVIEGCRPVALRLAYTRVLVVLIYMGRFADDTQVLGKKKNADTVSGPAWSSILTGVWADKHGVRDNKFQGARLDRYPSIFQRLKEVRPEAETGIFVSWEPIAERIVPEADEHRVITAAKGEGLADRESRLATAATKFLTKENPDLTLVYFGGVDSTGHSKGFHPSVPEYISMIETVDQCIGKVLKGMAARKNFADEDWLVIVTTDHGGRGTRHYGGIQDPEILTGFLIVTGSSAGRGAIERPTTIVDVAPTVMNHLQVPVDAKWEWDGQAVTQDTAPEK
ncbi:MAG: alkaline phosphatase family protein [Planctomycetales bacterium]